MKFRYLTQGFFDSPGEQVQTILHEPAHLLGINTFPFHTQAESYGSDVFRLDNRHALNNADNYAQYADQ
jgi:hypothetical protein